ncbi:hypothetical protein PM082_008181 [Marasmius tenuissimus]|nr:hypothetical protein PM082_008181 [Marasmius tenuissimus]
MNFYKTPTVEKQRASRTTSVWQTRRHGLQDVSTYNILLVRPFVLLSLELPVLRGSLAVQHQRARFSCFKQWYKPQCQVNVNRPMVKARSTSTKSRTRQKIITISPPHHHYNPW